MHGMMFINWHWACTTSLVTVFVVSTFAADNSTFISGTFNWTSLTPSTKLEWVPCYEQKECARFQRPMDPSDPSVNETVALAVLRSPAQVSRTDPNYGGHIFMNPGGPGGSGVGLLRWGSYEMQSQIAGPKYFDIISWDPRGVGSSTPLPECFQNDIERQQYWIKQEVIGGINTSPYALQYGFAAAEAFGRSCNSTIMRYMTTLATVQDMVAIADALEPNVTEPLINYWGISYGTFLGNTFASLYPHRLNRTVLDGVLGTEDYLSSAWHLGLVNTSAIYNHFLQLCYQVGATECPIWDNSTDAIRGKIDSLVDRMKINPLPVFNATNHPADVITAQTVLTLLFQDMYFPPVQWPGLAQTLHDLMQDPPNTTLASSTMFTLRNPDTPLPAEIIKPSNNSWSNPLVAVPLINNDDSAHIISYTDGNSINNWTSADAQNYLSQINAYFPIAAYTWPQTTTACMRWPTSKRAPEHMRFAGPFGSNLSSYPAGASPILFIGNQADAVCPLTEARQESAKHEGSVVLETEIYGHSTNFLNSNKCVWEHYRRYWQHGLLPAEATVCPRDPWAWEPHPPSRRTRPRI